MIKKPYTDYQTDSYFIRIFKENVSENDLVWHRDAKDRLITCLECDGWYLQLDNRIPVSLVSGVSYVIPKMLYHRVIKTKKSPLILIIKEEK